MIIVLSLIFSIATLTSQEALADLLSRLSFEQKELRVEAESHPQHLYFEKTKEAYVLSSAPSFLGSVCAHGQFSSQKYQTGWDALQVETFEACDPLLQLFAAGVVEGALLSKAMDQFYTNLGGIDDNVFQNIKKIHSNI